MSTVIWSTGAVDGGLVWVGSDNVVDIDEYEVMLKGSVSVCFREIVFVVDRLGFRQSRAVS